MIDDKSAESLSTDTTTGVTDKHETHTGVINIHRRLLHRLYTARVVVWGGMGGIISLTLIGVWAEMPSAAALELLRLAISTLATIVTLALGYIAGSNIEASK